MRRELEGRILERGRKCLTPEYFSHSLRERELRQARGSMLSQFILEKPKS